MAPRVLAHAVSGGAVPDTRLVATMNVDGIAPLVTFNTDDFTRYQDMTVIALQQLAVATH